MNKIKILDDEIKITKELKDSLESLLLLLGNNSWEFSDDTYIVDNDTKKPILQVRVGSKNNEK